MSYATIKAIADQSKKAKVVDVRSGDTVKVYQKIKEGNKERVQMFEGVVIRTDRKDSATSRITVRKITSGVGVEKSYLIHSPLIEKIIITKRGQVRRNYLSYLRNRAGKSARLTGKDFDKSINDVTVPEVENTEVENAETATAEESAEQNNPESKKSEATSAQVENPQKTDETKAETEKGEA